MKKITLTTFLSLLFSLFLLSASYAQEYRQEYGKLFRATQADSLYGPVLYSYEISATDLQNMITRTDKVLLLRYDNSKFTITDNQRNVMKSSSTEFSMAAPATLARELPMRVFSISKIQELIKLGNSPVIRVEKRKDVLSITNGVYTLEMSAMCPPFCS